VATTDLIPGQNSGASYFGEASYISPHEYTWCPSHPTQCNIFNNYSYRRFSVTGGPTFFNFPAVFYTSQTILVATKLFFFCSEKRKKNSVLEAGSSEKYNACHCHFRISMKHDLFKIWIQLQDSFFGSKWYLLIFIDGLAHSIGFCWLA
jgi:hypothetical protein